MIHIKYSHNYGSFKIWAEREQKTREPNFKMSITK